MEKNCAYSRPPLAKIKKNSIGATWQVYGPIGNLFLEKLKKK